MYLSRGDFGLVIICDTFKSNLLCCIKQLKSLFHYANKKIGFKESQEMHIFVLVNLFIIKFCENSHACKNLFSVPYHMFWIGN